MYKSHSLYYFKSLLFVLLVFSTFTIKTRAEFILSSPNEDAVIVVSEKEDICVQRAIDDLIHDIKCITGKTLQVQRSEPRSGRTVVIQTVPNGKWETFSLDVQKNRLSITGSDSRGTMFGIYTFLDSWLGVDPLYYWKDRSPEPKEKIVLQERSFHSKEPSVRYRGWFINDEDLLTKWKSGGGVRNIDYPYYSQVVHPEVMEHVVEALVRCRYNMLIPASFIDIMNPAEEKLVKIAASRGVFISQHHVEPLGVSAFTFFNYWKKKNGSKPLFSWYSNKEKLLEVWNVYAEKWSSYPNVIWQLGLRGIADRPMWMADKNVPQSDKERGILISEAMAAQKEIVYKYDQRKNPLMTTTLWAEGSFMLNHGYVKIPSNVIIVFSDNCPGWKFQDDFYSIARDKNLQYGVYYHHQLWGSGPHLVQGISPEQTALVLRETVEYPATDYAIFNVSNVREFALGIEATSAILWDIHSFSPDEFMNSWCKRNYPSAPDQIQQLYKHYFDSFAIRPVTKLPFLLDGQTRSAGLQTFANIKSYIQDPKGFKKQKKTIKMVPEPVKLDLTATRMPIRPASSNKVKTNQTKNGQEERFVHEILADMHPRKLAINENVYASEYQKNRFNKVKQEALNLLPKLSTAEKVFLENNLIAHCLIMESLSGWYNELLKTTLALYKKDDKGQDEIGLHLKQAVDELKKYQEARQLLTRDEKWHDWYRGEEKMNMKKIVKQTEELYNSFKSVNTQRDIGK